MSDAILARGPWAAAIRRYDPGLRVRWSFEKCKWAVDAPITHETLLAPPVRWVQLGPGDHWTWHLMPEKSERYIQFKDRRYVVLYARQLGPHVLSALWHHDQANSRGGSVGALERELADIDKDAARRRRSRADERAYAAHDLLRHLNRRFPWADAAHGGCPSASEERLMRPLGDIL